MGPYNRSDIATAARKGARVNPGGGAPEGAGLEQGWFEVRRPEPGVITIVEPLHQEQVKSSLVVGDERAVLIDTGMGVGDIRHLVEGLTDRPVTVVNSHAHWDHIGGNRLFAGDSDILIHEAEAAELERVVGNDELRGWFTPEHLLGPLPTGFDHEALAFPATPATRTLRGGEMLALGERMLEVLHAPGHSPGGIVLLDRANGVLFSTDVAYPGALYCKSEDADLAAYRRTMMMLADLAPTLRTVYPSHAETPMDPALLPRMRDGLEAIAAGRTPDGVEAGVASFGFDGFSVLVAVHQLQAVDA